ncbi:MAG: NYN domain-containing protein [Chloroflexi bacterium]|nr:NYN domain-containing protein [Chloroflexota bacterium]MCI0577295.1 NYN domain-containing protein [Chloroflexota bacterium]MCI0647739.1 NYN domain-containing protein [Chloroflexota bacterium]MCI0731603.1 NYN domain-containing protein [Chloroflexota bacterium]
MNNDVAIFLDLDNVVIGAAEANLTFDINLVLDHIKEITNGRLVLRRAYGDWRQRENMTKELASAGFDLQSTVRLGSNSKNLADMQMVVDSLETLVDGHNFATYVLVTGDRDFMPLVQALRKRGKQVIGMGIRHTTSAGLVRLCDQYVYYEELVTKAYQLEDDQVAELIKRALDQLLQEESRIPASLLKQRMQALSKGAFSRSRHGKRNFSKLLQDFADVVQLEQEETTLYVTRPGKKPVQKSKNGAPSRISDSDIAALLQRALAELTEDEPLVRASLLKQRMQELSSGAFDEIQQGDRSFRKFLDRHKELIVVQQEGSTLYVGPPTQADPAFLAIGRRLSDDDARELLQRALDELLAEQPRVRASLLKQRMQELSNGVFDESHQGDASFRHFLERHADMVHVQQKGTTLLAFRQEFQAEEPAPRHQLYRTQLKKRGLRVVPPEVRLDLLRDIVTLLQNKPEIEWQQLVDNLVAYYQNKKQEEFSRSYINDALRLARRANVVQVRNGGRLADATVSLQIGGERLFQEAVMRCDAAYLGEIQALGEPFSLDEAAVALYDDAGRARYLKILLNRYSHSHQEPA